MEYNEDTSVDFIRRSLLQMLDRPKRINTRKNYGMYDIEELKNRILIAINGDKLLDAYYEVSDIDQKKFRKKILSKNLKYLYRLLYEKKLYIRKIDGKWTID